MDSSCQHQFNISLPSHLEEYRQHKVAVEMNSVLPSQINALFPDSYQPETFTAGALE